MRSLSFIPILVVSLSFVYSFGTFAAGQDITIGIKEAAPFVMKSDEGYTGISIDLWKELATRLAITYTFEERDLAGILDGVEDGSLEAAIAAITITAEREARFDFSHPYYHTGFSILTRPPEQGGWLSIIRRIFSLDILLVLLSLCTLLAISGFFVWLAERRKNPEQFGGGLLKGIGSGFWWSAVTMTTVGYGDKAPATALGKFFALIWMFASLIILSTILAALTSAITLDALDSNIEGVNDLYGVRVATLESSTSQSFLQARNISHKTYPSVQAGVEAIVSKEVDAIVYDAPLLEYLAANQFRNQVRLVDDFFEPQDYGIALTQGSDLRERLNLELLDILQSETWQAILVRYLGE